MEQTHDRAFVVKAPLTGLGNVVDDRSIGGRAGPDYWWPEDRTWCVYTDCDATLTWVGGSEQLISSIEEDAVIESFAGSPPGS